RDYSALRRAVRDAFHPAEHAVNGRDIDHPTTVAEDRKSALRHERDAFEVRVDDRVPARLVEGGEVRRDVRPRVVYEDVDRPPLARDALEARANRRTVPHVERERDGTPSF